MDRCSHHPCGRARSAPRHRELHGRRRHSPRGRRLSLPLSHRRLGHGPHLRAGPGPAQPARPLERPHGSIAQLVARPHHRHPKRHHVGRFAIHAARRTAQVQATPGRYTPRLRPPDRTHSRRPLPPRQRQQSRGSHSIAHCRNHCPRRAPHHDRPPAGRLLIPPVAATHRHVSRPRLRTALL